MSRARPSRSRPEGDAEGPAPELVLLDRQVQAINRFPDQNPHPVMRMSYDGFLLYANVASEPVTTAWGIDVGSRLPDELARRLRDAASHPSENAIEVMHGNRTYSVLAVDVADLGFINLYGTDVTAAKLVARFPDQNPNPVLRVSQGRLIYANGASRPIVDSRRLTVGERVPDDWAVAIAERLGEGNRSPIEVPAGPLTFELRPVEVPEFGFINLYGTDVTAARQVAEANRENERLLLNILPPPIADRLRHGERVIADRFDDVTLLIADIVGFTQISSSMSPVELVAMLNRIFSACDELVDRHGLEKVKTIGDAYMVVGGLPTETDDHLERVADFALDLVDVVAGLQAGEERPVDVRVGMHCGPIVAGVIGVKKFIYDVWGDTVNQAARMESLSVPGRVHVTSAVRDRLGDRYEFEPRGVLDVKGKGSMATYFLTGRN